MARDNFARGRMISPHRVSWMTLVVWFGLLTGCHKSDAQRAAEERAKMKKELASSIATLPYRGLKLVLRSADSPDKPAFLHRLAAAVEETRGLSERPASPEEALRYGRVYGRLAVALWEAKSEIDRTDEDRYPLLWRMALKEDPPPGYSNDAEHILLAGILVVLKVAGCSSRVSQNSRPPPNATDKAPCR